MDVSALKKVFVLMVAVLLFSCGGEDRRPEGILPESKMIDMLIDFRLAEGRVAVLTLSNDSSANLFKELEKRVFEKHQVDSLTYVTSYQYYMLRPEEALVITNAVLDSLKVMQQIRETGSRPKN